MTDARHAPNCVSLIDRECGVCTCGLPSQPREVLAQERVEYLCNEIDCNGNLPYTAELLLKHDAAQREQIRALADRLAEAEQIKQEAIEHAAGLSADLTGIGQRLAEVEREKADMVRRNQILRTRPDLPLTHAEKAQYKRLEQRMAGMECEIVEKNLRMKTLATTNTLLEQTVESLRQQLAEAQATVAELRDLECQTQQWVGDVATEMLGYQYREISLGKLRELLQAKLDHREQQVARLRECLESDKAWLVQVADRFEKEWPNTANQCRIHISGIEHALRETGA